MTAPTIDPASAAAVVTAANLAVVALTARLAADPDSPVAEDIRTLIVAAENIAAEYAQFERRTS